jgi:SAM-dependent methyltransferase
VIDPQYRSLKYSLRRYYVDEFLTRQASTLCAGSRVLDVGGFGIEKRGQFDMRRYPLKVYSLNLSADKQPDIRSDAARLPLASGCCDAAICTEVLEHVPDPRPVIAEISRVLKSGGALLITVPFLFPFHADPFDFGRYTETFWRDNLARAGFAPVELEKQGLYWSVLFEMLRAAVHHAQSEGKLRLRIGRSLAARSLGWLRRRAIQWDASALAKGDPFSSAYTTGYGIRAEKAPTPQ